MPHRTPCTSRAWARFGALNALVGLLVGLHLTLTSTGGGFWMFMLAAPVSAFLVGGGAWWWIVGARRTSVLRALCTGLVAGTVSHYFTWLLLSIALNITYSTLGVGGGSLGDPPAGVLEMIPGAFLYSFFSLLFYGPVTVLAAMAAALLVRWQATGA